MLIERDGLCAGDIEVLIDSRGGLFRGDILYSERDRVIESG